MHINHENIVIAILIIALGLLFFIIIKYRGKGLALRLLDIVLAVFISSLGLYFGIQIEQRLQMQSDKAAVIGLLMASKQELIQINHTIEAISDHLIQKPAIDDKFFRFSNKNMIVMPTLFSIKVAASDPRVYNYTSSTFQRRIHNDIASITLLLNNIYQYENLDNYEQALHTLTDMISEIIEMIDLEFQYMQYIGIPNAKSGIGSQK